MFVVSKVHRLIMTFIIPIKSCEVSQSFLKWLLLCYTGVVPATEFLKDSGVPMTPRGEVIVDKVRLGLGACTLHACQCIQRVIS